MWGFPELPVHRQLLPIYSSIKCCRLNCEDDPAMKE
jgi:hypothetical protein